ncbi:Scp-like extracellular protein, partial [Globisporangium splendens]
MAECLHHVPRSFAADARNQELNTHRRASFPWARPITNRRSHVVPISSFPIFQCTEQHFEENRYPARWHLHALFAILVACQPQHLRGLEATVTEAVTKESIASFHRDLLAAVNAERTKRGLSKLCACRKLRAAAAMHSRDMASKNYMGHTGSEGSTIESRVTTKGFSYSAVGENVAAGQPSVADVMNSWMQSDGHRANILNPDFRFYGSAYAYNTKSSYCHHWTQVFAGSPTERCDEQ